MKNYEIEIIEILSRVVNVRAKNGNAAYLKVKQMYPQEGIVLDDSDYIETEFKEFQDE